MRMRKSLIFGIGVAAVAMVSLAALQTQRIAPDIPPRFDWPTSAYDYVQHDVMISIT